MEFRDYLGILRKYWISVLVITVLGAAAGAGYFLLAPSVYTAQVTVFLSASGDSTPNGLIQGSNYATAQARSFAQMVTLPIVMDPVIKDVGSSLSSDQMAAKVTTSIPTNTSLINISVTDGDAGQSAKIAQATAEALVDAIKRLSQIDSTSKPVMSGSIVRSAATPSAPTSPKLIQSLALGLLAGLVLAVGQAVLRKALDVKLHSESDVAAATGYPLIGTVPQDPKLARHPVSLAGHAMTPTAERYRQLRTNLRFFNVDSDQARNFVVTSSIESEGKTVTAINLAWALAEEGDRVLLVDADLRQPKVATYLGLPDGAGLTTVLTERAGLADVIQRLGPSAPDVLAAGTTPPNPAGLLGSVKMKQLMEQLSREYRVVVLDAAPLLPVADTLSMLPYVSGTVVVAAAERVTVPQLRAALESIKRAGAPIVGIVLNRSQRRHRSNNYYYTRPEVDHGDSSPTPARSLA
ncbi:MAG: polysaccharide biosynthesis tyrosine autokinase [Propionibacteriaceae bacterium]|nr:polysaccharide biosynthesis tyrosine autokinase [Propionibacteriaceae bacterium]